VTHRKWADHSYTPSNL